MPPTHTNQYGRKESRGYRPFLLIPKVIFVALYLGSLAAILAIWLASDFPSLAASDPRRLMLLDQISLLIMYLHIPLLLGALAFGAALFLQHPRVFLRLRWLQVKLLCLLILIPASHFFLASRFARLEDPSADRARAATAATQFTVGLAITLAASIWIIILGRLKPHLGQNWAKAYPKTASPA